MRGLGWLILLAGVVGVIAALGMDTSVDTGLGRVNNIGLLNDQQNYVILSGVTIVAGLIMIALSSAGSSRADAPISNSDGRTKICPECAETVKQDARVCRYCGNRAFSDSIELPTPAAVEPDAKSDDHADQGPQIQPHNTAWWVAAVIALILIVAVVAASAPDRNASTINNVMSADENLVTTDMNATDLNVTDMNATDLNATDIDMNAVDMNAVDMNAVDMNATDTNATEVSVGGADVSPVVTGSDAAQVTSTSTAAVPYFDTAGYCQKISDTAGGSYEIEETCRNLERDALAKLNSMTIPDRIVHYCTEIGDTAGGSYEIMETCVEQESDAASRL